MGNGVIVIKEPNNISGRLQICSVDATDDLKPSGASFKKGETISFPNSYLPSKIGDKIKFKIVKDQNAPEGGIGVNLTKVTSIPCPLVNGRIEV